MWEKITDLLRFNRSLAVFAFFLGGFGVMVFFDALRNYIDDAWTQVIATLCLVPVIVIAFVRTFWPGKKEGGNS